MRYRAALLTAMVAVLMSLATLAAAWGQNAAPDPASNDKENALPQAALAAMKAIDPGRIRAHTRFLSSDGLEGRGTGQRGGEIAAEYLSTQFALMGLKPAGENGGYMQRVPMVGITTDPSSSIRFVPAQGPPIDLTLSEDIVVMDETQNAASEVDAELVFVGYGIEAPEFNWDDYKDTDVQGKVLVMLVNEPPSRDQKFFNGPALTYYGRWTYKYEQAARKGAIGAILIHNTEMASYGWDVVKNSWGGERSYLKSEEAPKLKLGSWIQFEVARRVMATAGKDLEKLMEQARSREFRPVPLPVRARSHVASKVRPFDSTNVVAMLPGSDPELRNQAIVYTAHFDHLGIHPEQSGDNIYNGAVDNATGTAMLLEITQAYARAGSAPKRTVLFAAVTGEEQGLLGSRYLGEHPPVPARYISLGLNFDGLAPHGLPEEVELVGSERTTFYPAVQSTSQDFSLQIKPDSNPGAGFYYRSDHFSLARVGIPAFSVNQGMKFENHPLEWGVQQEREYNEKRYHQPSDEFQPGWDFSGLAKLARFGFVLGWQAADMPELVQWLPGDEFEAARRASTMKPSAQPSPVVH
jgi:Zn-dependent M28 family amino/carboxypeptidase